MKHWMWAAAWAAAALAHAPNVHAQGAPAQWNLATGYRAELFHTQNIVQFAQDVERATDGALRIQVHPDNRLVKLADIPAAVRAGTAQAGEAIMSGLVADMPVAGADAIPFVVGSYAQARRLWTLQRPLLDKQFAARGLRLLYAVPWPPQGLYSNKPIRVATDFRGTRMRTYNASTVRIAQLLGAQPVDVPAAGVSEALARGAIDNMITSAVTGVENKVWEHVGYYYDINAWTPKNGVFVNSQAFDALPARTQSALLQAAQAAEARGWERSQQEAEQAVAELKARGMKVERIPREVESELMRLGERFSREWVRTIGNDAIAIFVPYYTQ